ncbi:MAG: hypothetical protein ACLFVJ_11705, partial [Persicimonas sp.]
MAKVRVKIEARARKESPEQRSTWRPTSARSRAASERSGEDEHDHADDQAPFERLLAEMQVDFLSLDEPDREEQDQNAPASDAEWLLDAAESDT